MKSIMGVLLILIFVSCQLTSRKDSKLSDERLAHLMLDMQLAEVTLSEVNLQQQDSIKDLYDQRLEEIYHLSRLDIKNEMDKLQSNPKKLKWIINRAKEMADSIQ